MNRFIFSVVVALACGGCFEVSASDGALTCSETAPRCPATYYCASDNHCWKNGHVPADADLGANTDPCSDGVKDGDETDVDCGGPICTPCNTGKHCVVARDCRSMICAGGVCAAPSCTDGIVNGSESDVDCGGPDCPRCADGRACAGDNDCASSVCTGGACQPPSCADGFRNGSETGIDCGGVCPPCDAATTD